MNCKKCGNDVIKNPVQRGKSTRFVDENGKLWNGAVCPSCYRVFNRERMRAKRLKEKLFKLG